MQITTENWNTARLIEGNLMAFISLGAQPTTNDQTEIIYSVIVANKDYEEISEEVFTSLDKALNTLNSRFSHWSLSGIDSKNEGGCGSCAAH